MRSAQSLIDTWLGNLDARIERRDTVLERLRVEFSKQTEELPATPIEMRRLVEAACEVSDVHGVETAESKIAELCPVPDLGPRIIRKMRFALAARGPIPTLASTIHDLTATREREDRLWQAAQSKKIADAERAAESAMDVDNDPSRDPLDVPEDEPVKDPNAPENIRPKPFFTPEVAERFGFVVVDGEGR